MQKMSLELMLRGEQQSPLWPDSTLGKIGYFLGTPDRWDFANESFFSCQLGYADFEINLQARDNQVVVTWFWVELWDTPEGKPSPKKTRIRLARGIKVELGRVQPGLALADARTLLDSLGVKFQEFDRNDASAIVKEFRTASNAELLFFRGPDGPVLMEVHFFSADEQQHPFANVGTDTKKAAPRDGLSKGRCGPVREPR
jgi:hypothetical protein